MSPQYVRNTSACDADNASEFIGGPWHGKRFVVPHERDTYAVRLASKFLSRQFRAPAADGIVVEFKTFTYARGPDNRFRLID